MVAAVGGEEEVVDDAEEEKWSCCLFFMRHNKESGRKKKRAGKKGKQNGVGKTTNLLGDAKGVKHGNNENPRYVNTRQNEHTNTSSIRHFTY